MNIFEAIRKRIANLVGVRKLDGNPNSPRLNFISNEERIRKQKLDAYRVWYIADSDEIDNFYRNMDLGGFNENPIYNKNQKQYFHALSEKERKIKCVHTGIGKAAITTIVNVIGTPKITCDNQEAWDRIAQVNRFDNLLTQQIRPLTMVEGWGASKVIFNENISKTPLITFYEANDVDFIVQSGVIIGLVYKDYYEYHGKNYLLTETRRIQNKDGKIGSIVEYEMFLYSKSNEAKQVPLTDIPYIAESLPQNGNYYIDGLDKILGQPIKYLFDPLNKDYGLSFFAGKLDIMDDMDMIASIESLTEKNSSPVSYYPVDVLKRNKNGQPMLPEVFNRQFLKKPTTPDANGNEDSKIDIDAPNLDFAKYSTALTEKVKMFLSGWISPATMGIDLAKKDNADAQREKEKVTIMTRGNIIANETIFIKELVNSCLMMDEYMKTNRITKTDYNVNVRYNEFANPSMETMLPILGNAWASGEISTERYVKAMYPNDSPEEIQKEIQWLEENKQKDNLDVSEFEQNAEEIPTDMEEQGE